jgi:protein TonB
MDYIHEGNFSAKKAGGIGLTVVAHVLLACGVIFGLQHTFVHPEQPKIADFIPPQITPQHPVDPPKTTVKMQDPPPIHQFTFDKIVDQGPTITTPPPTTSPGSSVEGTPQGSTGGTGGNTDTHARSSSPAIANLEGCKPEYPRSSLLAQESGVVRVLFKIGADGRLIAASVLKSSGYTALDKAAVNGLSHCQFSAAVQDGAPVSSTLTTDYVWTLQGE